MPGGINSPPSPPQMALQSGSGSSFATSVPSRLLGCWSQRQSGVRMPGMVSCGRRTLPGCIMAARCSGVVFRQERRALMATLEHQDEGSAPTDFQPSLHTGTHTLPAELDTRFLPGHVAIIMDGNSRWAENRGWPASIGHEMGVRSLREVIELSCRWGIPALTVFAFSSDNWRRPQVEVAFLMSLFESVLRTELESLMRADVCISVMGDLSRLPSSLQRLISLGIDKTSSNKGLKFTVALSYSGRQDLVEACKRVASKVADGSLQASGITELDVERELGTNWMGGLKDPDLLIRTSGEQRLSNFMLWQLAYTELYFTSSLWPDFGEAEYVAALRCYQQRDRRFGGRGNLAS